jgi:hypothetical protein
MSEKAKRLGEEPATAVTEFSRYMADCPFDSCTSYGLTKREYFAAMVMQGWITRNGIPFQRNVTKMTEECVVCADALLEELCKEQPKIEEL